MNSILLVDDEPNVLRALARMLNRPDYDIERFTEPAAALERVRDRAFDLVLADYRMPMMDGVRLLVEVRRACPDAMRLILSGYADLQGIMAAINEAEIYRFISKPWDDYDLGRTVEQALAHRAMMLENRRLAEQVRAQQSRLSRQEAALVELERHHPDLVRVNWGPDGSILLDEDPPD